MRALVLLAALALLRAGASELSETSESKNTTPGYVTEVPPSDKGNVSQFGDVNVSEVTNLSDVTASSEMTALSDMTTVSGMTALSDMTAPSTMTDLSEASVLSEASAPSEASVLSEASAPSEASACPAGCSECGEWDGNREYECEASGSSFFVSGLPNDKVNIVCRKGDLDPSTMQFFPFSRNGSITELSLEGCALQAPLAALAQRLGARAVRGLTLKRPRGELGPRLVEGMEGLEMLIIHNAAEMHEVPWELVEALPALRDLRIRGGRVALRAPPADTQLQAHPSLVFLELAEAGVTSLPRAALARLRRLADLNLWENSLEDLTADSFIGLENVHSLDLSRNPLGTLRARVLSALPRLRSLTLVATGLTSVRPGALAGLDQLETIDIKFGEKTLELGTRALAALPALLRLSVESSPLAPLPEDLLEDSTALEQIVVTGAGLTSLPAGLFRSQGRLRRLDLGGNRLRALAPALLWPLRELRELNLNDNQIAELPGQMFNGLNELLVLTVERNGLLHIAADALPGATDLQTVSFAENKLTLMPKEPTDGYLFLERQSPFAPLRKLRELDLRGNHVAEVFSDWLYQYTDMRRLDLSNNNFTQLTKSDVQFLSSNRTVDMRRNHIALVELAPALPLPAPAPSGNVLLLDDNPFSCDCRLYSFIRRLEGEKPSTAEPRFEVGSARCAAPPSLAGRALRALPAAALACPLPPPACPAPCACLMRPATRTLELNCPHEPDTYPDPTTLPSYPILLHTNLRLHAIKSLDTFTIPSHVTFLNLSQIGLHKPPSLDQVRNVQKLDLSRNNLTSAPVELLSSNITLYLFENAFECDCSHWRDVQVMQKMSGKIADSAAVTCRDGTYMWYVDAARLCDVRRAVLLGGSLAALGVIAAVIAGLCYRYMLEIKLFLFSRGWCRSIIHEEEIDKDAEYDAFVSFSQEDARWVSEKLVPVLEGEHKFKLCVHYRDWVIGDMIPAQIARSVERSRRTIVVLSRSFLKSTWASLEFRAANIRAQKEKRARVLVVVLEDVLGDEEMDAELRAYLTTNTYLKWGDPWFWEKLRYAMPHKRDSKFDAVLVKSDKVQRGGLDARLNEEGKIVNDGLSSAYVTVKL